MSNGAEPLRQRPRSSCFGSLAIGLALVAGGLLLGAWLFMLAVGVVHGEWMRSLPTIGYWASVKVVAVGLPLLLAPILARVRVEGFHSVSLALVLTTIVGAIALLLLVSWLFMLGVGVVHHEWLTGLAPIGYWSSVKICAFALPLMLLPLARSMRRNEHGPTSAEQANDFDPN